MNNTHNVVGVQVSTNTKNEYVWKQTYLDKKTRKLVTENLNMLEMSEEHIRKAYLKCQEKVNEHQKLIDGWIDLMDKFENVCENRNIKIEYQEDYILKNNNVIPNNN